MTLSLLTLLGALSCAHDPSERAPAIAPLQEKGTVTLNPNDARAFKRLTDDLAGREVVYLGEIHDRYDHHVNQLRIIRTLHEGGTDLAVGMEAFQKPYQRYLDDYVNGRISESAMLRATRYYDRWRFDYRLYRDILRFARDQSIPIVALNAPSELVESVSERGLDGLSAGERAQLPSRIAPADEAYEKRLREAFAMHGTLSEDRLQRFMEVQSVWDAYMAQTGAEYLRHNPGKTLLILVGSAHVLHDSAIPARLREQVNVRDAVVVTAPFTPLPGTRPDYVLSATEIALPRHGRTGMTLRDDGGGRLIVQDVTPDSAAYRAGVEVGDRILSIEGDPLRGLADLRLSLTDSAPGDRLRLRLQRGSNGSQRTLTKALTLL